MGKFELEITGPLLKVVAVGNNYFELKVNVSPEIDRQIVEMRNIMKLKSYAGVNLGNQYFFQKTCWPMYQLIKILQETVRIWNNNAPFLTNYVSLLLQEDIQIIADLIQNGVTIQWTDREKMDQAFGMFFENFYHKVIDLENHIQYLTQALEKVEEKVAEFNNCKIDVNEFKQIIHGLQESVDNFQLKRYSNIDLLCEQFNDKINQILIKRCEDHFQVFIKEFIEFE